MAATELYEHLGYWLDDNKRTAYRQALAEIITPGDHVLDLGSGTGLLGLLALEAGAEKVWSYDSGEILGVARDIAEANGFADKIEFVQASTTEADLPPVDVVVCDQIGGMVFDAGVLEFSADVHERALRPGGTLIPSAFDISLVPIQAPGPYGHVDCWSEIDGFDLGPVRRLAANTEYRVDPTDIRLLADGAAIASIRAIDTDRITAAVEFMVHTTGTLHGLSGWFDARLSANVQLTNHPEDPGRMNRWLNFYPVNTPVDVMPGDIIAATIDIHPKSKLVVWSAAVNDGPKQKLSTFHGTFLFGSSQQLGAPIRSDTSAARAELLGTMARRAGQGATADELFALARSETDLFVTDEAALFFVRQVRALVG